ncbi:MAG: hypothetical protein Q9187_004351 [Circinaria calcarea]
MDAVIVLANPTPLHNRETSSLSSKLLETLNDLSDTQPTLDVSQLTQQINLQKAQIDNLNATSNKRDVRSGLACTVSRLVLGANKYIDAGSPSYTNETSENWQVIPAPKAHAIYARSNWRMWIGLRTAGFPPHVSWSKFAVRSGGQNPNPGSGSIDGSGVLIDMAHINALQISADTKSVNVGSGARWGEVYKYLDPYGLSAVGARSPIPAVGGFLMGGGIPFIPTLYGLGCDNVQNFEVVLGNSSVVNANATANSDLFFALKGGGPNYGIVTRFDLYTVPLHNIWYRFDIYDYTDSLSILATTVQIQAAMELDPNAHFIWVADNGTILIGLIYAEWTADPAVFRPFQAFTPISSFIPETNGTVSTLSQNLNFLYSTPATYQLDVDLYQQTFTEFLATSNLSSSPSADQSYTIQPIGKAVAEAGNARGGNPLGLSAMPQTWFNSVAQYSSLADSAATQEAFTSLRTTMEQAVNAKDLLVPFIFQNDAGSSQNPLAGYGATNLAKLRAASQKYDAQQVFQRNQFGGFKLVNA